MPIDKYRGDVAVRRYADTLFRFWFIAILPILVLPLGALLLTTMPASVSGNTNIWADQQLLQQLSYVDGGVPPAQNVANFFNQLLLSPSFDNRVAKRSPLYWRSLQASPNPRGVAEVDLTKNAQAIADGSNLVSIVYSGASPSITIEVLHSMLLEASRQISLLKNQQAAKDVASNIAQLKQIQMRSSLATGALGKYLTNHGIRESDIPARQLSDPTLASLYATVVNAESDLSALQQQLSKARAQEIAPVVIRTIDPPSSKMVTTSKKKRLTGLIIPLVLALLLGSAFVVIKTALDHTLRYADEVPQSLGLPVLAVLPHRPSPASTPRRKRTFALPSPRESGKG